MSNLLKKIEGVALSLSNQERAFLAARLLSSLCEDTFTDIDAAWIAEAKRRYNEYHNFRTSALIKGQALHYCVFIKNPVLFKVKNAIMQGLTPYEISQSRKLREYKEGSRPGIKAPFRRYLLPKPIFNYLLN